MKSITVFLLYDSSEYFPVKPVALLENYFHKKMTLDW